MELLAGSVADAVSNSTADAVNECVYYAVSILLPVVECALWQICILTQGTLVPEHLIRGHPTGVVLGITSTTYPTRQQPAAYCV